MRVISALILPLVVVRIALAADLTPETKRAFDRYIQLTEARLDRTLGTDQFLYLQPSADQKTKLRKGDVLIVPRKVLDNGKEIEVLGGLVQDWLGILFIPGATIERVCSVMQDYPAYKSFYKPEVIESRVLRHAGNEYDIFLRLYKKEFLTVVLNAEYHVKYGDPDPNRMYVNSRSTRIAEVKNPDGPYTDEEPVGHDDGFLWALNSYWRFERADGGVYAQLEAVSLSRDLPFGLMWLKGFLQKFPRDSMELTLKGTKRAVESRRAAPPDSRQGLRGLSCDFRHRIAMPPGENFPEQLQHFFVNRAVIG